MGVSIDLATKQQQKNNTLVFSIFLLLAVKYSCHWISIVVAIEKYQNR